MGQKSSAESDLSDRQPPPGTASSRLLKDRRIATKSRVVGDGVRTRVATVTVSTNDRSWLDACLSTLTASVLDDDTELHVILVDNASSDGSADHVQRRFPTVTVLRNDRNEGFAGANNRGIDAALAKGAGHVFLVNPDTRTPADLVQRLVGFMRAWPEYGIVGPLQRAYSEDGWDTELNVWSRTALAAGEDHAFAADGVEHASPAGPRTGRAPETLEHAYVQGSAFFCRADVIRHVGAFDPEYHTYYEETDLCRRARWAGWRVALLLDLGIQHYGEGGTRASLYRRRRMLRNKYYYLFTDPDWRWREIRPLVRRWLAGDLDGRGAAPADTRAGAIGDTAAGLLWLATRWPRMYQRRRQHAVALRDGQGRSRVTLDQRAER
jgi:GT2 family glycosyltransferase